MLNYLRDGTPYEGSKTFVRLPALLLSVAGVASFWKCLFGRIGAPDVDDFTAKGLQHLLHDGAAFGRFA
jgi:hypothetical protein